MEGVKRRCQGSIPKRIRQLEGIPARAAGRSPTECKGVNVALKGAVADRYVQPLSFRAFMATEASGQFDFPVRCIAARRRRRTRTGEIPWAPVTRCEGHVVKGSVFERPEGTAIAQTNAATFAPMTSRPTLPARCGRRSVLLKSRYGWRTSAWCAS